MMESFDCTRSDAFGESFDLIPRLTLALVFALFVTLVSSNLEDERTPVSRQNSELVSFDRGSFSSFPYCLIIILFSLLLSNISFNSLISYFFILFYPVTLQAN